MNNIKQTGLILLFVFSVTIGELNAQIRDDESSTNYLAVQCGMSSGSDASNFEEYGRKLAKTVALLSPGQQKRVFGFVPQPIYFARPEESAQKNSDVGTIASTAPDSGEASGGETGAIIGNSQSPDAVEAPATDAGQSAPEPMIGNTVEEPATGNSDSISPDNAAGADWWGGFMDWFGGFLQSIVAGLAEQQQSNNG